MKLPLRMLVIVATVGGGFTGFVLTIQAVAMNMSQTAPMLIGGTVSVAYGFVLAAGLLFVQNPDRLLPVISALALQVPFVSSPVASYRFTAGAHFTVGVVGGNIAGAFRLGSDFQVTLLQPQPFGVGVNLFALLLLIMVLRAHLRDNRHAP